MFAVASLPQFSLQAVLRHEPELWTRPVALTEPTERNPVLCDLTPPAAEAGVTAGLTPTQAMARCPGILLRPRSVRQETAATHALLQGAYAFSPHLEKTAPGVCTLDLRGLATVNLLDRAALQAWAKRLQQALAGVRLAARIGLGPTPQVARQAAAWGQEIEIVEDAKTFLASLPVAALEPSPEVAQILKSWGIRTVGEFLALGEQALLARLGLEALALFAASSSTTTRPLHLVHPTERYEEAHDFEPAVETLEPLLFLLRRFVDSLSQRLEWRGLVAETLVLSFRLESGQKWSSRVRLPQPTREPDALFRTLHTHLENVRTDSAIRTVALSLLPVEAVQKQLGLFETVLADPQQFQETLARLVAVLGPDRVGTPALDNSHRPDAFHLVAPDFEMDPPVRQKDPPLPRTPAPLRRYRPPLAAEVDCENEGASTLAPAAGLPGGRSGPARPVSIRCVASRGKLRVVVGPWCSSGHWWEPSGWQREEWDALTSDGQVLRLVHEPQGWFVEGFID